MLVTSVDEAKVTLYGQPLESFVTERDTLVRELRTAGERELAAEVKQLRKPSAVAAEVNRVVRADPNGVDLILQAAELLRAAQTGALDDSTVSAGELQQQYRAAIQALAQSADSRRVEVRAALEAATIDIDSNDDLRMGALVVVPKPVAVTSQFRAVTREFVQGIIESRLAYCSTIQTFHVFLLPLIASTPA